MKLTIIMVLLATFSVHASVHAQRVSIRANGKTLKSVLFELQRETGYDFFFNGHVLKDTKPIYLDLKNVSVEEAMEAIVKGQPLDYKIKENTVLIVKNEEAAGQQKRNLSGKIQDERGTPIIGATVEGIGPDVVRTATDENGAFQLSITNGTTEIVVTAVGYTSVRQKITPETNVIDFTMQVTVNAVDEVVVVGYGNMTRKDITSSITTVKSEDFNVGVYSSPSQILQGKVPGLVVSTNNSNPNATPSINLRGASTLRDGAATEPFYVIDGVPGGSLSLVSPDDIESIDVLRDASATAIYGSKAANGVIIVTTKKGKNNLSGVQYSGYVAADKVSKHWDLMDADQYRNYLQENNFSYEPTDDAGVDTDWQREVERVGISNNHNISIMGGNDKTKYSIGGNIFENNGALKGTNLNRQIGRAVGQTKLMDDRLELFFNLNASITKQEDVLAGSDGASVFDAMYYYLPFSPVKNEDGSWFENPARTQYLNPVALIEENDIHTKTKYLLAHAKASYEIFSGLKYNIDLSLQNSQFNHAMYNSSQSMVARNMNGQATRASVEDERRVLEMNLNYEKQLSDKHNLGALLGYSWEESRNNDGFQLRTSNFFDDALGYNNPGMGNVVDLNGFGDYYLSTLRMISLYGRINYNYDSRYLFQATVRRDGSSAFGANNRWATFPSVSAAWRLSEEAFLKDLNVFNDLKFRIGYGVSGNSLGFDVFTATQVYGATQKWFDYDENTELRTLAALRNANPDLKWERTDMLNIGLDFSILNNRLGGSVEVYNKNTNDLIYDYAVPLNRYLFNTLTANVGEINNKGIELSINAIPVRNTNFTWNTGLVVSHNKNTVKRISNQQFSLDYIDLSELGGAGQSHAYQQRLVEGASIGEFYTWQWAGYNEEGVSQFYVLDPKTGERTGETTTTPQYSDRGPTGSAQPKMTLGWNNNLSYKNWSMTAMFQGTFGNKIMNGTRARYSNVVGNAGIRNLLASVIETERPTDYNAHYLSDRYLENGSYLRLANLSLAYRLGNIVPRISNLRVYATVNNVFVLTKYKGNDPEVSLGGLTPGIDNRQVYPRTRTFMLGLNFSI